MYSVVDAALLRDQKVASGIYTYMYILFVTDFGAERPYPLCAQMPRSIPETSNPPYNHLQTRIPTTSKLLSAAQGTC